MRLRESKVYLTKISVAFFVGVLASCVPVPESGKEKADCGATQAFNSVSRKCYAINAIRSSPVPSTSTATISEDSGVNSITLNYTDTESDFATSCNVVSSSATVDGDGLVPVSCSCVGGICSLYVKPDLNFNGTAQAIYNLSDDDGVSSNKTIQITVTAVDDAPINVSTVPASVVTINEDTTQLFYLNYSDAENDAATACAVVNSTYLQTNTACACNVLGVCTVTLSGTTNYNGIGQNFQYRVYANGQWSSYSTVFVDISSVNDTPVLTSGNQSVTLLEDNIAAPGDIILVAGTDPDSTTNGDVLKYSVTVAATNGTISNCAGATSDRDCYYQTLANKNDDNIYANCLYGGDIRFVAKTAALADGAVTITFAHNAATVTAALSYTPLITVASNAITITINNGNTTGVQIKTAIEASASANALVGVYLLAGRGVTAASTGLDGDGNATAAGTCHLAGAFGSTYDTFTYKATDTLGPTDSASTRTVTVNVTQVNDAPTDSANFTITNPTAQLATEDTTYNFSIDGTISEDDLKDNITCAYVSASSNLQGGTLTNCLGQTGSSGTCDLTCTYVPYANYATDAAWSDDGDEVVVAFTYSDGTNTSGTQTVEFDVAPANDPPTVCQYSSYKENPKCGLLGCKGTATPVGAVTPSNHVSSKPIYYYNSSNGVCYKSTGTTSSSWTAETNGYIKDYTVAQGQNIVIKRLIIDEGGGDANENAEEVTISTISSSNPTLINTGVVSYTYNSDAYTLAANSDEDTESGSADTSSDAYEWGMTFVPTAGETGSSVITLKICDNNATASCRFVSFTITVDPPSATHNGWAALQALGPKVNIYSKVVDQNYGCPYSLTSCSTGGACLGTSAPASNVADTFNAIYLNTNGTTTRSDDVCYLSVAGKAIQGLTFYSKKSSDITITLAAGGTSGAETVAVVGNAITVTMESGVSTTNSIKAGIEASGAASALVSVTNSSNNATMTSQAVTTISYSTDKTWKSISMYCNVTASAYLSSCSTSYGASCIGSGAPSVSLTTATEPDYYYYDITNNACYRAYDNIGADSIADTWEATAYKATAEVTLTWESFTLIGSGTITGYNVYRRLKGISTFDYEKPINRSILASTATSYVDNSLNSIDAPVPKTHYEYEVRPLLESGLSNDTSDDIEAGATESYRIVEMIVPPQNMSFTHRWMMNKKVCTLMGKTPDKDNAFRCSYVGPGEMTPAVLGTDYYDIQNHLVTSRSEIGCPYSVPTPAGTGACIGITTDGTCIANAAPSGAPADGTVYYNRADGGCYVYNTANPSWQTYSGTTTAYNTYIRPGLEGRDYTAANLPPLTMLNHAQAHHFCENITDPAIRKATSTTAMSTSDLPNRMEQIALSLWDTSTSDTTITTLEEGLSLNSSSKCNSSSASGYSSYFSNDNIPPYQEFFTLPGSASSSIYSFIGLSSLTNQCLSHAGTQDLVGNVAEWSDNLFECTTNNSYNCALKTVTTSDPTSNVAYNAALETTYDGGKWYWFNRTTADEANTGPMSDADSDNIADALISNWTIADESNKSGHFIIPYGLPANTYYKTNYPNANLATYGLSEIGSSSGITSAQLHADNVNFTTAAGATTRYYGVTGGGDFDDGTGAGVFNMTITPAFPSAANFSPKIGFRCVLKYTPTL